MEDQRNIEKLNIILTGFMGTGKSTVGRLLAKHLKRSYIDTDQLVESKSGKKITEIFTEDGEKHFRDLESEAAESIAGYPPGSLVVSTGGGIMLRESNRKSLSEHGLIILLTAVQEVILERVSKKKMRPLLSGEDASEKIKKLLAEREECYSVYDVRIDTSEKTVEEIVQEIIEYIR